MRAHHRDVAQKLFDAEPGDDGAPAHHAEQTEGPEEVQRTREITKQETNGDEIKKDAERARDAVMRKSALAVYVADGNFADGSAIP